MIAGGGGGQETGGGGYGPAGAIGGLGGSGIIIVKYPDAFPEPTIDPGLIYDQPAVSGYKVYRFTGGTGTIKFNYF